MIYITAGEKVTKKSQEDTAEVRWIILYPTLSRVCCTSGDGVGVVWSVSTAVDVDD